MSCSRNFLDILEGFEDWNKFKSNGMRKEGFKQGDKIRVLKDYKPTEIGRDKYSLRDGMEGIFFRYLTDHVSGYQYEVELMKNGVPTNTTVWDIELISEAVSNEDLPKTNWHVVADEENIEILRKWRFGDDKQLYEHIQIGYIVGKPNFYGMEDDKGHNPPYSIKGEYFDFGKQYSFESFLREYPQYKSQNTIPEYVECLKDSSNEFTKGRIYKVRRDHANYYEVEMDDKGSTTNGWTKLYFKPSTKEEYEKQNQNMEEKINIGMERLVEYYNASTQEQKDYLNENFKLNGDCTKKALIGLRDIACSTWKPKIEANHPEVFKVETNWEDKWVQPQNEVYYRIEDDTYTCLRTTRTNSGSARKPRHAFQTQEQADLMAEKCKLMVEMQNFAAVHNEGWKPNWSIGISKWGIAHNEDDSFIEEDYTTYNCFVFGITVKTKEIAEKMLEEFEERIKQFYNEQY
jgi:hypothetical protein